MAISDTHSMHKSMRHKIPDGDVLIHCGDMSAHGTFEQLAAVGEWLGGQPHRYKIAIAGNHDAAFDSPQGRALAEHFEDAGVTYLQDSGVEIDGVNFYGSPWVPEFQGWHFMRARGGRALEAIWKAIPYDIDVLITHGPPKNYLDAYVEPRYIRKAGMEHVGCELLMYRIMELPRLKYHFFGHIHEGYGSLTIEPEIGRQLTLVNAATCTRGYQPTNPPQVIDL